MTKQELERIAEEYSKKLYGQDVDDEAAVNIILSALEKVHAEGERAKKELEVLKATPFEKERKELVEFLQQVFPELCSVDAFPVSRATFILRKLLHQLTQAQAANAEIRGALKRLAPEYHNAVFAVAAGSDRHSIEASVKVREIETQIKQALSLEAGKELLEEVERLRKLRFVDVGEAVSLSEAAKQPKNSLSVIHQYDAAACVAMIDTLRQELETAKELLTEVHNGPVCIVCLSEVCSSSCRLANFLKKEGK